MYYQHPDVVSFRDRVFMRLDAEVDDASPSQWIGKVVVDTVDGRRLSGQVKKPRGDPGNTLSRAELEDKAMRLAAYRNGAVASEMRRVIEGVWNLERIPKLGRLLSHEGAMQA
jgi:2-methylcitrate dehydratase PrpD